MTTCAWAPRSWVITCARNAATINAPCSATTAAWAGRRIPTWSSIAWSRAGVTRTDRLSGVERPWPRRDGPGRTLLDLDVRHMRCGGALPEPGTQCFDRRVITANEHLDAAIRQVA